MRFVAGRDPQGLATPTNFDSVGRGDELGREMSTEHSSSSSSSGSC